MLDAKLSNLSLIVCSIKHTGDWYLFEDAPPRADRCRPRHQVAATLIAVCAACRSKLSRTRLLHTAWQGIRP